MAAFEVLCHSPAMAHAIREGQVAQLVSVMQTSRLQGMQTMAQALEALHRAGHISRALILRVADAGKG